MKRLLLLALIFGFLFVALLMSCTKSTGYPNNPNIEVSFDVETQVNVSRYVIQTSLDGHIYTDRLSIPADNSKTSTTYSGQFYQPGNGYIYVQIKSIDIDRAQGYSSISRITL